MGDLPERAIHRQQAPDVPRKQAQVERLQQQNVLALARILVNARHRTGERHEVGPGYLASRATSLITGKVRQSRVLERGFPLVFALPAERLEDRVDVLEESLGEGQGLSKLAVVQPKPEPPLARTVADEVTDLGNADFDGFW